jgi:outer membrane protein TolC
MFNRVCISTYFNVFLLLLSVSAVAQTDSLGSYLEIAAQNNPALKSKYNKYLASLQKIPQVGSLPDPDLSFGYFIEPMEVIGGKQRAQIQLMQMFPWTGTLKAAKNEAAQMAQADFEAFRAEKEELWFNVRKSFYQLWLIDRQIAINDSALQLLRSIEQLQLAKLRTDNTVQGATSTMRNTTAPPASGKSQAMGGMSSGNSNAESAQTSMNSNSAMGAASGSSLAPLLSLQTEMASLENTIASLKQRKEVMQVQFNLLLNRDVHAAVALPQQLRLPDGDYRSLSLFDSIKQNNPMLKMSQADIAAYRYRQEMNRKMGYPMIGLGINYTVVQKNDMSASSMNGKDMVMPMLSVKLPIYRKKYAASVREAQLMEQSAADNAVNVQNMLFIELTDTQLAIDEANRNLRLATTNLALTQQNFNLLQARLSTSGSGLDELLQLQKTVLDYRISLLQAETDKRIAYAALQKLIAK